jgi:6-pyruvoyltetrahydropterin/6-carboxytetrahydropterin synthase
MLFACILSVLILHLSVLAASEFSLGIRDSIMIAHSFTGEEFGPAQNMHGATYTVDVDFSCADLVDKSNWVIDIGYASDLLHKVLSAYNFKNLNELFPSENTTTEFMCRVIHKDLCSVLNSKHFSGKLSVKLHESHKAWAAYSAPVGADSISRGI